MLRRMTAASVPPSMYGVLFPIFVLVLSDSVPKNGSRKSASTLSAAIIAPENVSFRWNVFVSISGTTLSYICQNAQIDRNASPTSTVRLLLSFISAESPFQSALPAAARSSVPENLIGCSTKPYSIKPSFSSTAGSSSKLLILATASLISPKP